MSGAEAVDRNEAISRRIELFATIIMSAAAILTAWAGFQSARWSGVQSIEYAAASASRIESTRLDARAGTLTNIDVDVFLAWLTAVERELATGDTVLEPDMPYRPAPGTASAFYFDRMREEFKPALEAWLDTGPLTDPDSPKSPFVMSEYVLGDRLAADASLAQAQEHTQAALTANRNSDNHLLAAVALALAIFFSGVSSKVVHLRNRVLLVGISALTFSFALIVLAILPKLPPL